MSTSRSPGIGLVPRFALASLAAFLLVGGIVTMVMVTTVRARAEEHAKFHATYIVDAVLAPDLPNIPADGAPSGRALERLDQLVRNRILSDGETVRVKIWSPDGAIIYSDDRALIGRAFPEERSELQDVLGGEIENGVSDLSAAENVGERNLADKLFETYVPLRASSADEPFAVAEVYQDYSAIQAEIDSLGRILAVTFAIGLGVLYAVLLPIALSAARTLRRKNEQLSEQADRLEDLLSREQQTVAELRHLNQMQADFVGAASHELRTPLTSVIGYLRTIQQQHLVEDPKAIEFLASAENQAARLSVLVQRLLSTAALEEGLRPIDIRDFELRDVIQDVLGDLPEAAGRIHALFGELPTIRSDADRLREIVLNLLENALKYSPGGDPVTLEAHAEDSVFTIEVTDHGIGIDPADLPAIFERFHQVDQSATRRFGGLGLGLHVTRALCNDIGGTIEIRSAPGAGSTFTVKAPLVLTAPDAAASLRPDEARAL